MYNPIGNVQNPEVRKHARNIATRIQEFYRNKRIEVKQEIIPKEVTPVKVIGESNGFLTHRFV
jgi:hypothetical protein